MKADETAEDDEEDQRKDGCDGEDDNSDDMKLAELLFLHSRHGDTTRGGDAYNAVCEVYSPPRVEPVARRNGFSPGDSLDLTTTDDCGRPWDFDNEDCRRRAKQLVRRRNQCF